MLNIQILLLNKKEKLKYYNSLVFLLIFITKTYIHNPLTILDEYLKISFKLSCCNFRNKWLILNLIKLYLIQKYYQYIKYKLDFIIRRFIYNIISDKY